MDTNPLDYEHAAKDKDWLRESADSYIYAPFPLPINSIYNLFITTGRTNNKEKHLFKK
jgi:hypothetical protein